MCSKNLVWVEMNAYNDKLFLEFDNGSLYEVAIHLLSDADYNGLNNVFDYIDNEDVFNRIFALAKPVTNED